MQSCPIQAFIAGNSGDKQCNENKTYDPYRDALEKALDYFEQVNGLLQSAGIEAKGQLQAEADVFSVKASEISNDLVACCVAYRESLVQGANNLRDVAADAQGEAKVKADQLAAKLQMRIAETERQIADARKAYIVALKTEIDYAKYRLDELDGDARKAMVDRIEASQAALERAKQEIESTKP